MQFGVFIPLMGLSFGQSPRWKMLNPISLAHTSDSSRNSTIKCVEHEAEFLVWRGSAFSE